MRAQKISALIAFGSLFAGFPLAAQMVSPAMDRPGEPFNYFSHPVDEIGLMDAEASTEITPEGFLRTGYGELMFFTGIARQPINARIRTLEEGRLPIDHYGFEQDGIRWHFTAFTAEIAGASVNLIRVEATNTTSESNRAILTSGMRYDAPGNTAAGHGDNRFDRPRTEHFPGDYRQLGESFDPKWSYSFGDDFVARNGRALYLYPADYSDRGWVLHGRYNYKQDVSKPTQLDVDPTVPVGIVTYSQILAPNATASFVFRMPVVPTADAARLKAIREKSYDEALKSTADFWRKTEDVGMRIHLPEAKAEQCFYTSLAYDLMARDHIGDDYIQTVNKLHYHSFYLRDGADIVHSYEVTGYPEVAAQVLKFFAKSQKEDGNFLSQGEQYDGWGEALWGYSQHYRMTHDKQFAEWALPQIVRAVAWLRQARAADPLHLLPASNVPDNEYVQGHLTGYSFLALSGLKLSIAMAADTGHKDLAADWQKEYDDYRATFLKILDQRSAERGGYIPPALDGQKGGYDWGNLLSVVPEPTLDPFDPRVTATLNNTQSRYQEGLITYADGEFLHHYLTIKNTMTEVIRGSEQDQQQALRELYALLLHTSSTHAGFEFAITPWGDRDFQDNLSPHGWFAAEYRTLLRTMLVREDEKQLHLMSTISPEWIGRGKVIEVENAPTYFGKIGFRMEAPTPDSATIHISANFDRAPESIRIHIPWFAELESAQADGRTIAASHGVLVVAPTTKLVALKWHLKAGTDTFSYDHAVADYKAEYARRYNQLMHGK